MSFRNVKACFAVWGVLPAAASHTKNEKNPRRSMLGPNGILGSPEMKALGELIRWESSRRLSVWTSVRASVHAFRHEYL